MNLMLGGKFAFNVMRTLLCHCENVLIVASSDNSPNSSTRLYTAILTPKSMHTLSTKTNLDSIRGEIVFRETVADVEVHYS
jgi:hypothetical protein